MQIKIHLIIMDAKLLKNFKNVETKISTNEELIKETQMFQTFKEKSP